MLSLTAPQRIILGIGVIAFVTLGIYAPWDSSIDTLMMIKDTAITDLPTRAVERHLILFPPNYIGYQVAIDRLIVEWLIVIVFTTGLILILKQNQTKGV